MFVYRSARENSDRFFIGIDPNARPLRKISEKIHRSRERGGAPNALYVQASIETLPAELDGIADEVHVLFPWGSLLRAVAAGDAAALAGLRRICTPDARLRVVIGLDADRDRSELERLGLEPLSLPYIDSVLAARYRDAGFDVIARDVLSPAEWHSLHSTWAKRLGSSKRRSAVSIMLKIA